MPQTSLRQRKTTGRVMHEFKHGELKSGRGGKGGKVKSRRQAIAIALKEAGASKYESKRKNERNLAKAERKEARGETYQQEREGKSHVGSRGRREGSRSMGGKMPPRERRGAKRPRDHAPARWWHDKANALQACKGARHRRPLEDEQAPARERAPLSNGGADDGHVGRPPHDDRRPDCGPGVRDKGVLEALRLVPRQAFVDPGFEEFAYEDCPLPIGAGQTISQPYIGPDAGSGRVRPSGRVLEVGAGSGYAAAL